MSMIQTLKTAGRLALVRESKFRLLPSVFADSQNHFPCSQLSSFRSNTTIADAPVQKQISDRDSVAKEANYWGIPVEKSLENHWPWNCFKPSDSYKADVSINLERHKVPECLSDKIAYYGVKAMRVPTDIFFRKRYGCRAMMLETVAAVPGMVSGMILHCRSLRKFEHSGGWIKALLEEAENERMHLMTFMEVSEPKWYERALVFTVQGVFFNAYFLLYLVSPRIAHRMVGYLEEEAIYSYTQFLKEIDKGNIENVPAPAIAIDYWRLPADATLRDVVTVVRADEAHHRDVNHFASVRKQPKIFRNKKPKKQSHSYTSMQPYYTKASMNKEKTGKQNKMDNLNGTAHNLR